MERSEIAILIPCFNEEKTISKIITEVNKYGVPIVINDKSTDKTLTIIKQAKEKIIYFSNPKNFGYEKSLQLGFEKAYEKKFKYVITFDADNQFYTSDINKLLINLEEYDIVIGQRIKLQRFSEYLYSYFFYYFFKIRDPLSGLKLYKIETFIKNKFIFDSKKLVGTELLLNSIKNKFKILTFDIKTKKREDSSRYGRSITANIKIIKGLILTILILLRKKK